MSEQLLCLLRISFAVSVLREIQSVAFPTSKRGRYAGGACQRLGSALRLSCSSCALPHLWQASRGPALTAYRPSQNADWSTDSGRYLFRSDSWNPPIR
ncbi:hypothetical protein OE88DRAFT_1669106 [Heliocybe sulcata]|uniref:Uncharacterized protein n=1 Tax=Heliocybe sulcata TaxID=5364 RepID=A0A5C3MVQ8_9AGAM|nr:hypothetical protein OE88DRAFT_1669106 [Heliocybe sulcata]